jgi:hypothetical protein
MQALLLNLKGFRGTRAGLRLDALRLDFERHAASVQLVAMAGTNGRGKSTAMDSMHALCCLRRVNPGVFHTLWMARCGWKPSAAIAMAMAMTMKNGRLRGCVADHTVSRVNWALDSRRLKSASKLTRCSPW